MMKLNRIKTVLVEKDLSQKWFSEQIGKSFSTTNPIVAIVNNPI